MRISFSWLLCRRRAVLPQHEPQHDSQHHKENSGQADDHDHHCLPSGDIGRHGLADLHCRRRRVGNPGDRLAAHGIVESGTHIGRGTVEVPAVEKPERQVVERIVRTGSGAQVGDRRLGQAVRRQVLVAHFPGDVRHGIIEQRTFGITQDFGREWLQQLQRLRTARTVAKTQRLHARPGKFAQPRNRNAARQEHRITPCLLLVRVLDLGITPGSHRAKTQIPCSILKRSHTDGIYFPENSFGVTGLPAAQPDIDIGQQGQPPLIPRTAPFGQPVEPVDVIGRRVEIESHENLRHCEHLLRLFSRRGLGVDAAAQLVGLLLAPLLIAGFLR